MVCITSVSDHVTQINCETNSNLPLAKGIHHQLLYLSCMQFGNRFTHTFDMIKLKNVGKLLFAPSTVVTQSNIGCLKNLERHLRTSTSHLKRIGHCQPEELPPKRKNFRESLLPLEWNKLIHMYPEFLPDPINTSSLLVSQAVDDMIQRRCVVDIPEFYVGSIMAVTVSDMFAETKKSRFVGICIHRTGQLKFANFTLRNVIDGMGCEIRYDLYNPSILSIEVLKLEKRIDDSLIYLRDALPEYSTVPEDMKAEARNYDGEVPVNKTLVKMKPFPWSRRWERWLFRGIEKLEDVPLYFAEKAWKVERDPVYSYDLMLEYRRHCTEEMMYSICRRLAEHEKNVVTPRREARARRYLQVAKKPSLQTTS